MRPRITLLATAILAATLLPAAPASARQPTLCEQVRAWSGEGCTSKNTRAYWAFKKREQQARATRDRGTAGNLPAVLRRIRGCESGSGPSSAGNYRAENPRSTASGAYQFLDSTWRAETGLRPPASAYSPATQDKAALSHYRANGTRPWSASKGCWG